MINSFVKDSLTYAVPALLARGIGLFLLPVYTRYLTPEEYGVIELLTILFALLNILITLEVTQAVARLLPNAALAKKKLLASTAFNFTVIVFTLLGLFIWIFPSIFSELLFGVDQYIVEIKIASFAMVVNALFYLMQNHLRWCLQVREFAIVGVIYSALVAAISIYLVAVLKIGVKGILIGQLVSGLLALILSIYFSTKKVPISLKFDIPSLKEMLIFSIPLVFSSLAVYINTFVDRWFINSMLDLKDVGIYSVALRIALIPGLIVYSFQMALTPLIYHHYREEGTPYSIARLFNYFLFFVLPILVVIGLFAEEIVSILAGKDFSDAAELVFILSFSLVLMNIYIFSPGLGIAKLTSKIAIINIIAAITNILLNINLIPIYGRLGAAIATLCGSIVMAGLYYWWGNKKYTIPYDYLKCVLAVIILFLFILLGRLYSISVTGKILNILLFTLISYQILLTVSEKRNLILNITKIFK